MRFAYGFTILFCLQVLVSCGSGIDTPQAPGDGDSSQPPVVNDAHPTGWLSLHGSEALDDLLECQGCHGSDYSGSGDAVSCYICHVSGPPFAAHPSEWADVVADHQDFSAGLSWTACATAACHGSDLQAGDEGPSCFNLSCHASTAGIPPAPISHQGVDFTDPVNHGAEARDAQYICLNCHGRPGNVVDGGFISDPTIMNDLDFNGTETTGDCSICHPAAGVHPTNWQGDNDADPTYPASHRSVTQAIQSQSCALCHSVNGPGTGAVPTAPSCFSESHTNADLITSGCHLSGSLAAPHPIDGSYYFSGHGKDAKTDLTECQKCHADQATSGPGSNPRFNMPIGRLSRGCETCHGAYFGHPPKWSGPDSPYDNFHYSSKNIVDSCTLCHGVNLDGVGGVNAAGGSPGRSCLDCHAETTDFTLDCTACHGYPPDGVTDEPLVGGLSISHDNLLNAISADATTGIAGSAHNTCLTCHGVRSTDSSSGGLSPAAEYKLFDPVTDTAGDHWNGQVNMNGPGGIGSGYNPNNFGCDNALCHGNDARHQLSDSALPVAFGDYGTGFTPHAQDGSFLDGAIHGPVAKSDLTGCKACHGEATNINPRFNFGIVSAGGVGCESCHNPGTAHPSSAAPDSVNWYDDTWRHTTVNISASTCGMCHVRSGWAGSVAPACTSCHVFDPVNASAGTCNSCHGNPPNGMIQPNRRGSHAGEHSYYPCTTCHTNAGPGSSLHFTPPSAGYSRADLRTTPDISGANMTITVTPDNVTCSKSCHENHGEGGAFEPWYY